MKQIELSVESGQVFGFLGPNGVEICSHQTIDYTFHLAGSMSILGIDAVKNLQIRHKIGVVLQQLVTSLLCLLRNLLIVWNDVECS